MVTLEQVKQYLNLDSDFKDDDKLLVFLINSTENSIKAYCNTNSWDPDTEFNDKNDEDDMPSRVEQTQLMLIASLYKNREMIDTQQQYKSPMLDFMLGPLIKYTSF